MPIFEFECEYCGRVVEDFFPSSRDVVLPSCQHGAALCVMKKIVSRRAGHRLTGDDERTRVGRMISAFHRDYLNSRAGKEQLRDDPCGKVDVTKLADQVAR